MYSKTNRIFENLFLIALFCFSISLFNLAGYIFAAIIAVMYLIYGSRLKVGSTEAWLFLFSLSYFLLYCMHFEISINLFILYLIGPWSAYLLGKVYIRYSAKRNSFAVLLLVPSIGMFMHGLLNIVAYLRSDYFSLYDYYRQSVDFWRGELVNVKSTEMLYTFCVGIGLGVLFTSYKKKYKLFSAVIIIISLAATMFMANRGLLIILIVVFLWRIISLLMSINVSAAKKVFALGAIAFALVICVLLIAFNIGGFGDAFFSLKLVQRFTTGGELTRFDVWRVFFDDMKFAEHPLGGRALTDETEWNYLHNMWLDIYNVVGVIPFIISIILTVKLMLSFRRFGRFMKAHGRKDEYTVTQSLVLSVFLNMMIEPIIEANPYFLLIALLFLGAMEGYMQKLLQCGDVKADEQ